eukprot:scaffold69689_cov48-Prasinocladus_malaysianus.AAC.1
MRRVRPVEDNALGAHVSPFDCSSNSSSSDDQCQWTEASDADVATPNLGAKNSAVPNTSLRADAESDSDCKTKERQHLNPWYRFWTLEETEALVEGVEKCGGGKWAIIKKLHFGAVAKRSAVDLKDKWRNLSRIALLPPGQVKLDKKREATCPPELLAKVRKLIGLENLKRQAKADKKR